MLKQIRDAAHEARHSGFLATADALEMFANTHIETTVKLFAVEGEREQAVPNQENDFGNGRRGASAKNC